MIGFKVTDAEHIIWSQICQIYRC